MNIESIEKEILRLYEEIKPRGSPSPEERGPKGQVALLIFLLALGHGEREYYNVADIIKSTFGVTYKNVAREKVRRWLEEYGRGAARKILEQPELPIDSIEQLFSITIKASEVFQRGGYCAVERALWEALNGRREKPQKNGAAQANQNAPVLANSQVAPSTECIHHWLIAPPNGQTSTGKCKNCGRQQEFCNSVEETGWGKRDVPTRVS